MASPAKSIIKPRHPNPGKRMHPKRIITAKERENFEKYSRQFSFARKDPAHFALGNRGLIFSGMDAHNLRSIRGVSEEDIEQECFISMIKSAKGWLPHKGSFATYAIAGMKACKRIIEENHCNLHFSSDARAGINGYRTWKRHNPEGTIEDFAAYREIPLSEAREIEWNAEVHKNARVPKDGSALLYGEKAASPGEDSTPYAPYIPIERVKRKWERFPNPVSSVENASLIAVLNSAMSSLADSEKAVLQHFYGLNGVPPKKLKEIAEDLGTTAEKAKLLFNSAFRKLKNELERKGVKRELLDSP